MTTIQSPALAIPEDPELMPQLLPDGSIQLYLRLVGDMPNSIATFYVYEASVETGELYEYIGQASVATDEYGASTFGVQYPPAFDACRLLIPANGVSNLVRMLEPGVGETVGSNSRPQNLGHCPAQLALGATETDQSESVRDKTEPPATDLCGTAERQLRDDENPLAGAAGDLPVVLVAGAQNDCPEALGIVDRYLNDQTVLKFGSAAAADIGDWRCGTSTGTGSAESGLVAACESTSQGVLVYLCDPDFDPEAKLRPDIAVEPLCIDR